MEQDLEMQSLVQIINGAEEDEQCDEEFYEKIEAPKFVDFTAPERRRPDDDCYWFCMRVGCDRKHEEEIDPEAIYNNFVLRVMAARSPNVRFRRALDRKALSTNLKCPQTAPSKPTRTRGSRLETLSSISHKMVGDKPLKKLSATPNVKATGAKALTTPRSRKRISNPRPFQSVRKPNALDAGLAKNKVVAKTLIFHSPKKAVKLKASLELNTPLRKICSGMKKLEITSQKKHVLGYNKPLPSEGFRKKLGAREVKSRVFDSLRCKGMEVKSSRCIKKQELKQCEVDEKSRKRSLDVPASDPCKTSNSGNMPEKSLTTSENLELLNENSAKATLENSRSDSGDNDSLNLNADDSTNECKSDETTKTGSEEEKIQEGTLLNDRNEENDEKENAAARDEKENASSSDVTESHEQVMESDDKENASAPDANREHDHSDQGNPKSKILGKNKNSKCTQKVIQVFGKTVKDSNSVTNGVQVTKYRKPKPTNPKPFRLRTDERRILKEANMEKKLQLPPLNEITTLTKISRRKQLDPPREGTQKDQDQPKMASHVDLQLEEHCLRNDVDKEVKGVVKRTKSPLMKQPAKPQGLSSSGKKKPAPKMPPGKLSTISETSQTMLKPHKAKTKPMEKETVSAAKALPTSTSRSTSRGRTRPHVPEEPNINSFQVLKKTALRK